MPEAMNIIRLIQKWRTARLLKCKDVRTLDAIFKIHGGQLDMDSCTPRRAVWKFPTGHKATLE